MQTPWRDLKKSLEGLRQRRMGKLSQSTISRLRRLVEKCRQDPDADASICYHGSLALLFEFDRDWSRALKHRHLDLQNPKIARVGARAAQWWVRHPELQG